MVLADLMREFDLAAFESRHGDFAASIVARFAFQDPVRPVTPLEYSVRAITSGSIPIEIFFDPDLYISAVGEPGLAGKPLAKLVHHWLNYGVELGIVPTLLFDEQFYKSSYPEISELDMLGMLHFLGHGLAEGRAPTAWFDTGWYASQLTETSVLPLYLHYVVGVGRERATPLAFLDRLLARDPASRLDAIAYRGLLRATARSGFAFSSSQVQLAGGLFVPQYYIQGQKLDPNTSSIDALQHFFEKGLAERSSPTPLFDAEYYSQIAPSAGLPSMSENEPIFVHWLRYGAGAGVSPTPLFDKLFYHRTYPDTADGGYRHFAQYGVFEGRDPHIWFDNRHYRAVSLSAGDPQRASDLPPYLAYLMEGMQHGREPIEALRPYIGARDKVDLGRFTALAAAGSQLRGAFDRTELELLLSLFLPEFYRMTVGLSTSVSDIDTLINFFEHGLGQDLQPGPLFDKATYLDRLEAAGLSGPMCDEPAILHWARIGANAGIVPSNIFDPDFYRRTYPDLAMPPVAAFMHFARSGLYEGRRANKRPLISVAPRAGERQLGQRAVPDSYRLLFGLSVNSNDAASAVDASSEFNALTNSARFRELVAQAALLEPAVGTPDTIATYILPPFHQSSYFADAELRSRIPHSTYETIICVPWTRMGGADLVASYLAAAVLKLSPDERVLMLATDFEHKDWSLWLPPCVDVVAISDVFECASDPALLFYQFVAAIAPHRLININSRLCWETFRRFGARLQDLMHLSAYLFCYELTREGERAGYVTEYFAETVGNLDLILTDHQYLKDELCKSFALPTFLANRLTVLHTPTQNSSCPTRTAAEASVASRADRRRPLILWAGRLDRQKRFDLVITLARAMDDVDFLCWGAPILDDLGDLPSLPANLELRPPFLSLNELPLARSDGWLYTSLWDGMPTLLIDLAVAGVAVAASAVGGVRELIDSETGWPINEHCDLAAFEVVLRDMLNRPAERVARSHRLQKRAWNRHSPNRYEHAVAELFNVGTPAS